MSALGRVVRSGVGRRRVQTTVLVLTTLIAVAFSILGAGLLVASQAPFDHAFARQQGAHLTAQFDGSKATQAQLAATARAKGVSATAGPYAVAPLNLTLRLTKDPRTGGPADISISLPQATVAGRASAKGAVDKVGLDSGKWATSPGQIVLSADLVPPDIEAGATVKVTGMPGAPTLTLVGIARSVGHSADGWVSPAQLAALTPRSAPPSYQMLYRFDSAATSSQVAADRAVIAAAVPSGALTGSQSYLSVKEQADSNTGAFVPFVVAFAVIGLLLSVLIISLVVSGAVVAGTRRIGILKALGFTPLQVVRAYVGQALIPALAGAGLGVVCGNLLSVPLMGEVAGAYRTGTLLIPLWVDFAVPAGALALVTATALVPALRAGRLRTVQVITVGRTPRAGRGRRIQNLVGRLPLPRALSLGLAHPFARPSRTATVAVAVVFGAVAVTFAVGLNFSLTAIQKDRDREGVGSVVVLPGRGPQAQGPMGEGAPVLSDPAAASAAISKQRGTKAYFGATGTEVHVAGITSAVPVTAYQGDSSWGAYRMNAGRWFSAPGEAVAPTRFLHAAGVRIGDSVTLSDHGRSVRLRIVGETFDLTDDGMTVRTEAASLTTLDPGLKAGQYNIALMPGTDLKTYLSSLNSALGGGGAEAVSTAVVFDSSSSVIMIMEALIATLTLLLVAVAVLGVLNTVVLDTRERIHDLGVFKALGMSPRQTVAMVLTSVASTGLVAGLIGVPIGIAVHGWITPLMGHGVGTNIPAADIDVYHAPQIALLALGGLVIAGAGALLPAVWAARTRTGNALRTE
ncbi:ABC transporter permease [Streptomyces beijiangensis]|uniref:ABC transporter permease n=1 Tax=Streptomyces beijiangensis TaxID=163361 RepID=A0A939F8R2_9ACTN|nr:FtsX-like permease family protein [Streptomyces beijiangensis]MBO0512535.1 ABC transporter permease [Streptomyces beijiangensis]